MGHKKLPQISQIHTDSLSLTQVLHKRKFFLSYLVAKKMQTSAKKACFQFVECSFSYAEDTTFPCNFQGFREKILEKDEEKEK